MYRHPLPAGKFRVKGIDKRTLTTVATASNAAQFFSAQSHCMQSSGTADTTLSNAISPSPLKQTFNHPNVIATPKQAYKLQSEIRSSNNHDSSHVQ